MMRVITVRAFPSSGQGQQGDDDDDGDGGDDDGATSLLQSLTVICT